MFDGRGFSPSSLVGQWFEFVATASEVVTNSYSCTPDLGVQGNRWCYEPHNKPYSESNFHTQSHILPVSLQVQSFQISLLVLKLKLSYFCLKRQKNWPTSLVCLDLFRIEPRRLALQASPALTSWLS